MSNQYKFSQESTNEQAFPLLSVGTKVSPVLDELIRQYPVIAEDEEVKVSPADYAHLKQEYLLLVESINKLEAENTNLRLTVQFYQDVCLDD